MADNDLTTLAKRLRPLLVSLTSGVINQTFAAGEGPGIDLVGTVIGLGLDSILISHANGDPASEYATISAACAAASAGDIIFIAKPGTFAEGVSVPANVGLVGLGRDKTKITGQVTLGDGALLYNLSVDVAGTTGDVYGIVGPGYGQTAYCINVKSYAYATTGTAAGLYVSGGKVEAFMCDFEGESLGVSIGIGYGVLVGGVEHLDPEPYYSYQLPSNPRVYSFGFINSEGVVDKPRIPLITEGGADLCTWINHAESGSGDGYIIYDLGANYHMTKFGVWWQWGGWSQIDGSTDLNTWYPIKAEWPPQGNTGWEFGETDHVPSIEGWEENFDITARYIRFKNRIFALLGGGMKIGWFYFTATTDWLFGYTDLYYCKLKGTLADIRVQSGQGRVYACQYDYDKTLGIITPAPGDRSAWDALEWPDFHANDIDNPDGIHWSKSVLDDAYSAITHNHEVDDLLSTGITNGWIPTADGSGGIIFQEPTAQNGNTGADIHFFIDGALAVAENVLQFIIPRDCTIDAVRTFLLDQGSANSTILDVHLNGVTIFTTQANRPTVAFDDADGKASAVPDVTVLVAGDILSIHVDAVATGAGRLAGVIGLDYSVLADSEFIITHPGDLEVETVYLPLYNQTGKTKTLKSIKTAIHGTADADITIDILLDGVTSIFTVEANRPTILAGQTTGVSGNIGNDQWLHNHYLIYRIVTTGTTTKGSDMTITVVYT